MALGMEVGLGPGYIVLDGDPAFLLKKGAGPLNYPQFAAHFYCGQTAGCMKMLLSMEVDLSRRRRFCVTWGGAPNFRPTIIDLKKPIHASYGHPME